MTEAEGRDDVRAQIELLTGVLQNTVAHEPQADKCLQLQVRCWHMLCTILPDRQS